MLDFKTYSQENLNLYSEEIPELLAKFIKSSGASILDLGCGDGPLLVSLYNNNYLSNAKKIVGVDLSPERLERLKAKNIPRLETVLSDACEVKQLEDTSFDCVFNTQVIEHVPDDKKLLKEIRRLLKKDGVLYISSVVKKKYGWYVHRCNGKWVLDPTHLREYPSQEEFVSLIESAGFKPIELQMVLYHFTPVEFLIRRIYFPIFKTKDINSFFLKHKLLNKLKMIKIPVLGYYTIELIAKKQ